MSLPRSREPVVVIPCGKAKVWDRDPWRGSEPARDAYIGTPFKVNRAYAEAIAPARWFILSAKYGLIPPLYLIEAYDVSFKDRASRPIEIAALARQARAWGLDGEVIGLGGKEYREALSAALSGSPARLIFPFAGLSLGHGLHAIKRATTLGTTFSEESPKLASSAATGAARKRESVMASSKKNLSATQAAIAVLEAEGKPMKLKDIVDAVLARKDVKLKGRGSVQAPLNAAVGKLFKRTAPGTYALIPEKDRPAKAEPKAATKKNGNGNGNGNKAKADEAKAADEASADLKEAAAAADAKAKASAGKPDPKKKTPAAA